MKSVIIEIWSKKLRQIVMIPIQKIGNFAKFKIFYCWMVSYSHNGARGLSLQSMSNQLFLLLEEEAYSLSDSFRDKRKEEFK